MWLHRSLGNQGEWKGPLQDIEFNLFLKVGMVRDQNLGLVNSECFWGRTFPSCSEYLFHFFTILIVKFFPCSMLSLVPVAVCHASLRRTCSCICLGSGGCRPAAGSTLHLLRVWTASDLSLSSHHNHLGCSLMGLPQFLSSFRVTEEPRMRPHTPKEVSQVLRGGERSLPLFSWFLKTQCGD